MTEQEDHLDDEVLMAWEGVLGSIGTQEIARMPYGSVWSITTQAGQRFVLKRLPEGTPRSRFVEEARVVAYLAEGGLPVAPPIINDDGRAFTQVGRATYSLTRMLSFPRDVSLPSAETVLQEQPGYNRAIGRAIAEMHVLLANCPYKLDRTMIGPDEFVQRWGRLRTELSPAIFQVLNSRVGPRVEQVTAALASPAPQLLHGDCHGGNLLFSDGRVTGILDVDHLPVGPRVYDLAYNLAFHIQWMIRLAVPDAKARTAVSSAAGALLEGYLSVSPLSEAEQASVAPIALHAALSMIAWAVGAGTDVDVWVRIACWIADHEDTLRPRHLPDS